MGGLTHWIEGIADSKSAKRYSDRHPPTETLQPISAVDIEAFRLLQYPADRAQSLIYLLPPESTALLFTRLALRGPDRSFGGDRERRLADCCSRRMLAFSERRPPKAPA